MVLGYRNFWKLRHHICLPHKQKAARGKTVRRVPLSHTSSMNLRVLRVSPIPTGESLGRVCMGRIQGPLQSAGVGARQMLLGSFHVAFLGLCKQF